MLHKMIVLLLCLYAIKKMVSRDCVFLEKALLRKIKTETNSFKQCHTSFV